MPQLLPAAIAYILPSTAATAFTIGTTAVTYASIISTVLVAGGSYFAAQSMMSMPDFSSLENQAAGKLQMTKETTPSRRVIYGTHRVSGPIAYAGTSEEKNVALDLIILLAGHECAGGGSAGHRGIYLNDVRAVEEDGTINAPFSSANLATLMKLGYDSQTPVNIPTTEWQNGLADRKLNGITYLHVGLKHDPQVFPSGIPQISVVLDGKKVYSVTGSFDTKVFSDNPADILYDFITDNRDGLGVTTDEIDLDSFQDAHAICNEIVSGSLGQYQQKRYTCNMTFQTSEKPQSIIENILKSCYGKLIYNGKFVMKVGAYSYPTVTLNEADLRDGITLTTRSPSAQAYNKVTGLYIEGSSYTSSFQSAEFVPYTSSFALLEDNGVESVQNIELLSVTNQRQARRLGAIALLDSRQDMVLSYPTKASGLMLQAGDNVYINNSRFGFENKSFEVTSVSINPDLSCDLTLKESSPAIYAWAESEQDVDRDISPNTTLPDPFTVEAIASLTASNVPTRDSDGTIFPGVELTWPAQGSGSISRIELNYKEDIASDWTALARLGAGATSFTTIDVTAGTTYQFQIRAFNYFGVASPYTTASLLVTGDNTIPQAPTGSASVSTGSVTYTWTYPNPQEADYKHTKIVINGVSQGFVAGTTYTKVLSGGGPTTASFQDFDTSGNGSATSSLVLAYVTPLDVISSGSAGPSGSAGDIQQSRYVVYDVTPTVSNVYDPNPTGTAGSWLTYVPNANGSAIWVITATTSADGLTVRSPGWSSPTRFSGNVHWYSATAPSAPIAGDWWFNTSGGTVSGINSKRWARYNGSSWVDANALIELPDFPSTFKPVAIGNALPSLPNASYPIGSTFCTTTDGILYRNDANSWTAAVSTSSLVGQITTNQITANAITTGLIAAGALTASHVGTNTLIANTANIADAVITSAKITDLAAGKITAGTITAAVTMSAAYINGGKIDGGGLTVYSAIGIRAKDNSSVLTITGGDDNGSSNGAQIDLTGNSSSGQGALILQAGQGTQSSVRFLTNQSPTTDVGVLRGEFDTYGLFRVTRNQSNGNVYTTDAGNGRFDGNLGVGKAPLNTNSGQGQIDAAGDINSDGEMNASAFNSPSARRFKENIHSLTGSLEIVMKGQPKTFDFINGRKNQTGFIAEEMLEILPSVVVTNNNGEVAGIDYGHLTPILWAAIQEQQRTIDNLRQRITVLERR